MARKFILTHELAPGDVVVTTSLVRDLKLKYGRDIEIDFLTNFPAVYENNPYLTRLDPSARDVTHLTIDYSAGIRLARQEKLHFTTYQHRFFAERTGLAVEPLFSKPDLHLSEYEQEVAPITGRYWLVFGGGKKDMTTKHWEYTRYQEVVDRLRPYGLRFVQSGSSKPGHTHPPMRNVLNVVGWGYVRQLIWQVAHCEGVICPITCAMHLAAAFDKPCVVIAGGREEPWWEAYVDDWGAFGPAAERVKVPHRYLHTLGLLDCCEKHGCWKRKVIKTGEEDQVCKRPVFRELGSQIIPECLDMITVDHVVEAVMSYYEDGTLPPIGAPALQTDIPIPPRRSTLPRIKV